MGFCNEWRRGDFPKNLFAHGSPFVLTASSERSNIQNTKYKHIYSFNLDCFETRRKVDDAFNYQSVWYNYSWLHGRVTLDIVTPWKTLSTLASPRSTVVFSVWQHTVIDWVREQQQFCLTIDRIDPFEGQTKLLVSEEPLYNCFVIHRHCDVNITWLIEPMKIRPSVNSSTAGNRSMNCWLVNRTVMQLIGILL